MHAKRSPLTIPTPGSSHFPTQTDFFPSFLDHPIFLYQAPSRHDTTLPSLCCRSPVFRAPRDVPRENRLFSRHHQTVHEGRWFITDQNSTSIRRRPRSLFGSAPPLEGIPLLDESSGPSAFFSSIDAFEENCLTPGTPTMAGRLGVVFFH